MTTLEDASVTPASSPAVTPVVLGGARGGPDVATLRTDRYWVQPVVTFVVLTSFVAYASWAAFVNQNYFVGESMHRTLISPFYSPCLAASCVPGSHPSTVISWWTISPALLILIFPLGFRMTCYYYRKAYYRAFWLAPPACAVSDGHGSYSGESRFPLLLQNAHRYFFYFGLVFNVILTIDAIYAFRQPGFGLGISVGTAVLIINATLLWLYSLSCHACRHLCGGGVKQFSKAPIRHKIWKVLTPLNGRHMLFAWLSLVFVAFTDFYVRMVASGAIQDYGFHF
ncbi:MAG: hypothetical protein WCI26_07495 [Acidimicrobiales bacterium]